MKCLHVSQHLRPLKIKDSTRDSVAKLLSSVSVALAAFGRPHGTRCCARAKRVPPSLLKCHSRDPYAAHVIERQQHIPSAMASGKLTGSGFWNPVFVVDGASQRKCCAIGAFNHAQEMIQTYPRMGWGAVI
jgi:hypothetical protein